MSDQAQGPGWWQASDGNWYPPQAAPQPLPPTTQGVPIATGPNPGSGDIGVNEQTPWYEQIWVLALSLLFCFPIGLIFVWINKRFSQTTKIVVTAVVLALATIAGITNSSSPPVEMNEAGGSATTVKPTTTAPPTTAAPPPTTAPPPPTTAAPPPTTAAPPPTEPARSVSEQQAVRAAQSYLDFSGFSRQGLIDQISSEYGDQFSVQDATAAVDSLNVDYNAEAVQSASSYLEFSGFSCQGLIDQLSSEYGDQYTIDQANFAASQVGLC